jgi:hypothetical protein
MKNWLLGIAATVIGGVLIYWLTEGIRPQPPQPPLPPLPSSSPRELSFLEKVAGKYTLSSWTETNRPIELGAKITEGSLQIDQNGVSDWSVLAEQTHTSDPGKVRMTARGKIQLDPQAPQMVGVSGGGFNNTHYFDSKWGQVSDDVNLAVRGWDPGNPEDKFRLSLDSQAGGKQILQMTNSRGIFTWTKI